MAEFPIDVTLDPRRAVNNARRVESALGDIEDAASRVQSMVNRALAFTGVSIGLAGLTTIVDEFTNYQNRIRSVTKSQAEFNVVQEELFNLSQRTRTALDANAVLFQRTSDAIRRQGFSLKETFQFQEAYNQALILGGSGAQEAEAATIQFAQGLGAGVLRGEELNSVLEQSAVIADVIAAQFGVTRGELKSLGEQGLLTTQQIVQGFLNARQELQDRFGNVVPTISQSFQVLRNTLVRTIGTYDQGAGASRIFSTSIIALADNLDTLLRILGAVAITTGTVLAAQAIPKAVAAINSLTVAIAANPLGALLVAITAVVSLLVVFSDRISVTGDGLVTLRDFGVAAWEQIQSAFEQFLAFFDKNFGFIADFARETFGEVNISVESVLRFGASAVDTYLGLWKAAYNVIRLLFDQIPLIVQQAFAEAVNSAAQGTENIVNAIISRFNSLRGALGLDAIGFLDFDQVGTGFKEPAANLGKEIGRVAAEGFNVTFASDAIDQTLARSREIADERRRLAGGQEDTIDMNARESSSIVKLTKEQLKQAQAIEQYYQQLVREGEALQLSNSEREIAIGLNRIENKIKRELTDTERERIESQLRLNQQLKIQADIMDQINGPVQQYRDTISALNTLLEQGRISTEQYNATLNETALSQGINDLKIALNPDEFGNQIGTLQEQLLERQMLLQQAREADLISEQEYFNLSLEANKAYNQSILDIEAQRQSMQLQIGQSVFGQLAQLTKGFVGEQNRAYQVLFLASKAFAVADSIVQIQNAIAKAANSGPFPANLAAMAGVVAATGRLVSTITSTSLSLPTFQNGGSFRVGGAGGTDSQLVQFRASPNETVSVRTPSQERQAQKGQNDNSGGGNAPVIVQPINVVDPNVITDLLNSPAGRNAFINMVSSDASAINQALGR